MTHTTNLKLDKLSEASIRAIDPPQRGEVTYTITYTRGLTLRVRSTGSKTFYARLWNPRIKKVLRRKLGEWPTMNGTLATTALEKLKRELEEHKWNTQVIRKTLSEAFTYYLDRKKKEDKSKSFIQQIEQAWRCVPADIQPMLLDDIPMHRLSELVSDVGSERKGTAFQLRRLIKAIYKLSLVNEWCTKDRTLTIEPIRLQPRRLLVDNAQIAKVLETARKHPDNHKVAALLLCAATGQRGAEIMKLRWENIGVDKIIFPAEIRKQRVEHTVWLNELAYEALSYLQRSTGSVFPMAHRNWLSDFGKVQGRKAGVKGFGVHQLRKAVISNLLSQRVPVNIEWIKKPTIRLP